MRILFICGSAEPGRCGVGDYTRMLSVELAKNGHHVFILALDDWNMPNPALPLSDGCNPCGLGSLEILRISRYTKPGLRFCCLQEVIQGFQPDCCSLQYVPYAYSSHGIPLWLIRALRALPSIIPLHVMFHEVCERGGGIKSRARSIIQRSIVSRILHLPSLGAATTSILEYKKRIYEISGNQYVGILPLFGNIPLAPVHSVGKYIRPLLSVEALNMIYFGSAPDPLVTRLLLDRLLEYSEMKDARINLLVVGNLGANGPGFMHEIHRLHSPRIKIVHRGACPPEELSRLFIEADVGIARVPFRLLGKSGSTISMLEHGLPVWCPMGGIPSTLQEVFDQPERELIHVELAAAAAAKRGVARQRLWAVASAMSQLLSSVAEDFRNRNRRELIL